MNPTPRRGAANKLSRRGRRKENSDKPEENAEAQGEEIPRLGRARVTRSASASAQARSLDNQVHFPPPLDIGYTSAINTNAALASGPRSEAPSIEPPSIEPSSINAPSGRSKSPVKSMADLSLADKPIRSAEFGTDGTKLPLDVRELYKKLKALSNGKEILPTIIKVNTLTRQGRGHYSGLTNARTKWLSLPETLIPWNLTCLTKEQQQTVI